MKKTLILLGLCLIFNCSKNELLDQYTTEISALKTEQELKNYWKELHDLDQITYLKETKGHLQGDSISITNMIRTALMFEIHGDDVYTPDNVVPILNFTHNYIGDANLAFWPIIQKCKKTGGVIESFGGKFPAYQLEGISITFYDFSLFRQDNKYNALLEKLNNKSYNTTVSETLFKIQEEQKKLAQLEIKDVVGKWHIERMNNIVEKGFFEFVKMSDNSLYLKRKHRLQKLIPIETTDTYQNYKIENEPFGWTYKLSNGNLSLLDDKGTTLIDYNAYN
ncbi:hypothetical protein [uncultured Psychroserpens sp.]|uniref:hypothetical protein n=1 Tax=uncultured Psychroserpens sp. TaxID=255436 RepID=UPI00262DAAE4|nr:hypothetical protein [uncultured Psychroserpens sp.]